ncbi:50S ribosomal protein L11 methyltransferase, partial [Teredinibacter franksiae]|uniref:50S ribosomal protein L11 methyltransferase n=1 Tax=Teredinibacter franksiae TaxID=2761453 RepID=UPI0035E42B37
MLTTCGSARAGPLARPKCCKPATRPRASIWYRYPPTTFLCLQWLAEQKLDGQNVIDYGCGSGILGIAALLLGASHATGTDIDPQALLATQDNVAR